MLYDLLSFIRSQIPCLFYKFKTGFLILLCSRFCYEFYLHVFLIMFIENSSSVSDFPDKLQRKHLGLHVQVDDITYGETPVMKIIVDHLIKEKEKLK